MRQEMKLGWKSPAARPGHPKIISYQEIELEKIDYDIPFYKNSPPEGKHCFQVLCVERLLNIFGPMKITLWKNWPNYKGKTTWLRHGITLGSISPIVA